MNRTILNNPKISATAFAAATLALSSASAAHAQRSSAASNPNVRTGSATSYSVSSSSIPGAVEPIMNRAASFLRVAQARQNSAPGGAKESYRNAAQAFRQLLTSNRLAPAAGTGTANSPLISSFQVADDIRTLRAAAKSSSGSRMTMLNNAASLYATGAKEYFTAQLREALFDTNVTAAGTRPTYTPGRRRPANPNVQGGIIQNPPGLGDASLPVSPTIGGPVTVGPTLDPGTTIVAPTIGPVFGGGVANPGVIVPTAPVPVPATVPDPNVLPAPAPVPVTP